MTDVHPEMGAYAHSVEVGDTVYVSGQVAVAPDGTTVGVDDVAEQARQVFANVGAVLARHGLGLDAVVSLTTYLVDAADAGAVSAVRREHIPLPFTSTVVVVAGLLRPEWRLEVQATAARSGGSAWRSP